MPLKENEELLTLKLSHSKLASDSQLKDFFNHSVKECFIRGFLLKDIDRSSGQVFYTFQKVVEIEDPETSPED